MWPLFSSLYKGSGSILGWIALTDGAAANPNGTVLWTKPQVPLVKIIPEGLTNTVEIVGSKFIPAKSGQNIVNWTNGVITFSGGNVSQAFTNSFRLASGSKVVNLSSNKMTMSVVGTNGLFSGSVVVPGTGLTQTFKGVLLQGYNSGYGYFLETSQSGAVEVRSQ